MSCRVAKGLAAALSSQQLLQHAQLLHWRCVVCAKGTHAVPRLDLKLFHHDSLGIPSSIIGQIICVSECGRRYIYYIVPVLTGVIAWARVFDGEAMMTLRH
jgi:hypothetical protein